jgi:hypothetical protein
MPTPPLPQRARAQWPPPAGAALLCTQRHADSCATHTVKYCESCPTTSPSNLARSLLVPHRCHTTPRRDRHKLVDKIQGQRQPSRQPLGSTLPLRHQAPPESTTRSLPTAEKWYTSIGDAHASLLFFPQSNIAPVLHGLARAASNARFAITH